MKKKEEAIREVEDWVAQLEVEGKSPNTIHLYLSTVRRLANCVGKEPHQLTISDLNKYVLTLVRKGRNRNYIRTEIAGIQSYLKWKGLTVKIEKPKREQKLPIWVTNEELHLMIDHAGSLRNKCIISLLFSAALRSAELVGLNRDDVDLDHQTVRVYGKGGRERIALFSPDTATLLRRYLATRNDDNPALFPSAINPRLSQRMLRDLVADTAKKAGIKKPISPHKLRHGGATYYLSHGLNLREVQTLLGHKRPETTAIYTHIVLANLKKRYQKIWETTNNDREASERKTKGTMEHSEPTTRGNYREERATD